MHFATYVINVRYFESGELALNHRRQLWIAGERVYLNIISAFSLYLFNV